MESSSTVIDGPVRIALATLDGFLGLTAVLGGLGLVTGALAPPLAALGGSPFRSYAVPGLALLVLVGGSGLAAAALLARRRPWGIAASALAGLMVLIFEAVELAVVGFTGLLAFYVALGVAILALAARLWRAGDQRRVAGT